MNTMEFSTIASAIQAAYPNHTVMPDRQSKEVWYTMLNDLEYKVCLTAIKQIISTSKFPPSIADIREKCTTLTCIQVKDWGDAWQDVLDAIRFSGMYQENEAIARLDDMTAKCVKRLGYQNLCTSENIVADRANFRMIYEQEAKRTNTYNQLQQNVKYNMAELTNKVTNKLIQNKEEQNGQ